MSNQTESTNHYNNEHYSALVNEDTVIQHYSASCLSRGCPSRRAKLLSVVLATAAPAYRKPTQIRRSFLLFESATVWYAEVYGK